MRMCWPFSGDRGTIFLMRLVPFAQSILEYGGSGSRPRAFDSFKALASNLLDGLKGIDQQTWMLIAGVLIVLTILTRRSRSR